MKPVFCQFFNFFLIWLSNHLLFPKSDCSTRKNVKKPIRITYFYLKKCFIMYKNAFFSKSTDFHMNFFSENRLGAGWWDWFRHSKFKYRFFTKQWRFFPGFVSPKSILKEIPGIQCSIWSVAVPVHVDRTNSIADGHGSTNVFTL